MSPGDILRVEYLGAPCYVRVERVSRGVVHVSLPSGVAGHVVSARPARVEPETPPAASEGTS